MANGNEKLAVPVAGKIEGPKVDVDIPHSYTLVQFDKLCGLIHKFTGGMESHIVQDLKYECFREIDRLIEVRKP